MVTVLFGITSTSNTIEIARDKAECYFNCFTSAINPYNTGYPCYHSLIIGQFFFLFVFLFVFCCCFLLLLFFNLCAVAILYRSLTISIFHDYIPLELYFQSMAPLDLFKKKIPLMQGLNLKNDIVPN